MVEIGENFKFGQNFRKILIFIETSRCRPKYLKISIFLIEVKSFEMYLDFGQNWEKWQFWSKYLKISILIKIFEIALFRSKLSKNPHFGENFEKSQFWSNFRKISIDVKLSKNPDFRQNFRKIEILVKIFEILGFGKILVEIVENIDLWNFPKQSDSGQNSRKFQLWS